MTTDTLEAYEAEELAEATSLAMLDEVAELGRLEGRGEALADVEDTIVESLDQIEATVESIVDAAVRDLEDLVHAVADETESTLRTVATWVSELHVRLHTFEERVTKAFQGQVDDEPDYDLGDIRALEAELDDVTQAEEHIAKAVNELAKGMFFLAEAPKGREVQEEADENIEFAYWSLMKARSDVGSWALQIQATLAEVRS
jgi:hypothetical protein